MTRPERALCLQSPRSYEEPFKNMTTVHFPASAGHSKEYELKLTTNYIDFYAIK